MSEEEEYAVCANCMKDFTFEEYKQLFKKEKGMLLVGVCDNCERPEVFPI
jgi:hypothetical protein